MMWTLPARFAAKTASAATGPYVPWVTKMPPGGSLARRSFRYAEKKPLMSFDGCIGSGSAATNALYSSPSMYVTVSICVGRPDLNPSTRACAFSSTATELNAQARVEGFKSGLPTQMETVTYMLGDEYKAFVAAEPDPMHPSKDINGFFSAYLKDLLASDPPGGIFVTQGTYGPVAADAVLAANLAGKVHIIAFDLASDTQRHLRNHVIDAAIVQKSYFFGYLGTYILWAMAVN